ncbi:MAG: aminotransferase class V-fold PLP-dependent enzyme, partial [Gammaproteobacteria bacterium]
PWPARTAAAVSAFAQENRQRGSQHYPAWLAVEQTLREQLRQLINAASADEIALLKNTSEALSVVAYGLPWKAGDNVVITSQEFPSNRIVWESLQRYGVETRRAEVGRDTAPEAAIIACIDRHTQLLSVSSVQYGTGLKLDLETLGAACRKNGILFCVDAIQSLGAVELDVQACGADFVMADGHKWLLGPEGIALFYCRAGAMDRLTLRQYGWHMVEEYGSYDSLHWEIAHSARRFECGSPNMTGIHALHASLSLIHEIGMRDIQRQVLNNSQLMMDFLARQPARYRLLTPVSDSRHAGIVTFAPLQASTESIYGLLAGQNVLCALRGGGIRFSPHFYTPREKLSRALELLVS